MSLGTPEQYEAAPWMKVAESYLGVREIRGGENPVILKFFAEAGHPEIREDEVAWCSAFANAVMFECGLSGTKNLMARSWLKWSGGTRVTEPQFGDIAVFSRGPLANGLGHVNFFLGWDEDTVTGIGGNQGLGEVDVSKVSRARLIGFIRPKYAPVAKPVIPSMTDKDPTNSKTATTTAVGAVATAGVAATGNFELALLIAAAGVSIVFLLWYIQSKEDADNAKLMAPQFRPSSYVTASEKVAAFEPPVPGSRLVVTNKPKRQRARKTSDVQEQQEDAHKNTRSSHRRMRDEA